jgi:pimeloyl-ACP methyl ester carboxylesterase
MDLSPAFDHESGHPTASEYLDFTEHYALINGIQIYYECENCEAERSAPLPPATTPLLFIHGWTANRTRLHPLYMLYVQQGYPVFRIDLRGHGWSQKGAITDFSFTAMISDLEQFIKQIICKRYGFKSVILVAHSMGGSLCMGLAAKSPAYVEKMVFLATSAHWAPTFFARIKLWLGLQVYRHSYMKNYQKKKPGHEPMGLDHFPMWGLLYNIKGRDLYTYPDATLAGLVDMRRFDIRSALPSISIPTLIMVGDADEGAPISHSQAIHDLLPNSQLEIISRANHDLAIGKPVTLKRFMDEFFQSLELSGQ